jgi:GT2 family glycosyltransferase
VAQATRHYDEVVVVDSASLDASAVERVTSEAGAKLVRCIEPGTSRARNTGWKASMTDIVVFTDDDCVPDSNWIEALVRAFESHPGIGFVTGRIVPDAVRATHGQLNLSVIESGEPVRFDAGESGEVQGHGANMAWTRKALEAIGGFDEGLGPGTRLRAAEDADAFRRMLDTGGAGYFEPSAIVVHRQWRTRREQLAAYFGYGIGAGALVVKRRRLELRAKVVAPALPLVALWKAMSQLIWRHAVVGVARNVAQGYATGVVAEITMLAGATVGVVRSHDMQMVDGHFGGDARSGGESDLRRHRS